MAVSIESRARCRDWCRADRQRPELHPARPLVWSAAVDRHGGGVFGDRRRRAGAAAAVADTDRASGLARRLPDLRLCGAGADAAVVAAALEAVLDRFAVARQARRRRPGRSRLDALERDAASRVLGAVLNLLFH